MLSNHQDRSATLDRLLDALGRFEPLDAAMEARLAALVRAGDKAAARDLANGNLGRVAKLARTFRNKGVPLEDLVSEGAVGLMQAAAGFDPKRGVRFFTYAAFFVRRAMVGALARGAKVVRVPRQVRSRVRASLRRVEERSAVLGRGAALDEEAARLGLAAGELTALLAAGSPHEVSLDDVRAPRSVGRWPGLAASAAAPDADVFQRERVLELRTALDDLPERERHVLERRFGLDGRDPETLRSVGFALRLSKERVRQIEERSLIGLRLRLEDRMRIPPPFRPEVPAGREPRVQAR